MLFETFRNKRTGDTERTVVSAFEDPVVQEQEGMDRTFQQHYLETIFE